MSYLVSAKPLSLFGVELSGLGASPSGLGDMTPPLAWAEGLLTQGHPLLLSLLLLHLLPPEEAGETTVGRKNRRNRKPWSKRGGQKEEERSGKGKRKPDN